MQAIGRFAKLLERPLVGSRIIQRAASTIVSIPSEKHPWLAEVPAPASFKPEERILCFLAANTAAGNIENVERDWKHLPITHHAQGAEIILQIHTLAGFPRSINALIRVEQVGMCPIAAKEIEENQDLGKWQKDGLDTMDAVYGSVSDKMLRNFKGMHPLLELMLVEHAYGRILSRPLVSLRVRELATLAVTAGMNLPVQMFTHLRGCLRTGATREEVVSVVEATGLVWGPAALTKARHIRDQKWSKWASADCEIEN
eukprot:CAMPEP_0113682074 /NCGR_PEP_ID=MMETSP0038_2-20120614/12412_1 /TAXON_ID=2898 /ORGANISM="Cryptomonas paramecium" /LENGTH=256 /DNA_ID=CAMNT_0000601005 /DNA_START=37 /DNA_END=807 /DNA_ORIENTATION=+ /assembly_acc=CAM_ASM_000170